MNDVCRRFGRFLLIALAATLCAATARAATPVQAPAAPPPSTGSRCIALAQNVPDVLYIPLQKASLARNEVSLTFIGHATFRIETGGGVVIATDYTGFAGPGRLPDVVTMNHAHSSHYTNFPDPKIKYVLRGWGTEGHPARYNLTVGDVLIRNVTTDIRGWGGIGGDAIREKDGNSIFIFEVADLCIGHLGHLHHKLGPEYLGLIGQLDVVMVPVDGAYTMEQASMIEVLKLLKARLILPMHYFNQYTLSRFLSQMDQSFDIEKSDKPTVVVSPATLPQNPKILLLRGGEFFPTDP